MKKKMKVITATTIRRLIDVANSYSVQKDDIVDIETGRELLHSTKTVGGSAYKTITLGDVVTVKFDANGGTVSETERELERGSVIGNLPTPTWTNYEFLGWFKDYKKNTLSFLWM